LNSNSSNFPLYDTFINFGVHGSFTVSDKIILFIN
jgi:hypothetical protein